MLISLLVADDAHAACAEAAMRSPGEKIISDFGVLEVASALNGLVKNSRLLNGRQAMENLRTSIGVEFTLIQLDAAADLSFAQNALMRFDLHLRTCDAVHLAIVDRTRTTLVTFDVKMRESARTLGLAVMQT